MNVASPDLLTLLAWAERLAAGGPCAPWEAWSSTAPDAEWKWERISLAHDCLAGRCQIASAEIALPAEVLAQFVEGQLTPPEQHRVEQACWESTAQLMELVSTARFMRDPLRVDVSSQLESRLLSLVPQPKLQQANGKAPKFRLAGVGEPPPVANDGGFRHPGGTRGSGFGKANRVQRSWQWPLIAAVLLVAVVPSGTIGWLAATWRHSAAIRHELAQQPSNEDVAPRTIDTVPVLPSPAPTPVPQSEQAESSTPSVLPPENIPEPKSESPQPAAPPSGTPKYRPRIAPATPQLAIQSEQGLLLADAGQRGKWRVAPTNFALHEPVKLLSLPESWTKAEIPGVGTLVCEGSAEASVSAQPDGAVEIRLIHGRIGIDHLQANAQLRVLAGEAAFTARATTNNSTLAIIQQPRSPGLLIPRGSVSIDDVEVAGGQMIRWSEGTPRPPEPISTSGPVSDASQNMPLPPPINPWDLGWLQPPDENAKKLWRTNYGRVVDRLAQSEDVAAELPKALAGSRDPRQTALLAHWNIAAVASANRAQQIWNFLTDRRTPYRVAGVRSILEMPPGDERLIEIRGLLDSNIGAVTAGRVEQWMGLACKPGPPPKPHFEELVLGLMNNELAVRQISVSLLELHTEGVLRLANTPFPAYEAASSRSARQAGQAQWATIMTKLYTPSRKDPNFLTPPATPLIKPAPQNASPLGTTPSGT